MDMFYVVVMELEQRGQSYAQDRATRVYDSPLPGIFLCSVISGCGTGKLRLRRRQSGCRQPVQARGKMNQTVSYFSHGKTGFHVSSNIHAVL